MMMLLLRSQVLNKAINEAKDASVPLEQTQQYFEPVKFDNFLSNNKFCGPLIYFPFFKNFLISSNTPSLIKSEV